MGGLDPAKLFLLLVIVLVVVGPEKLPGAARQLGGMVRELNKLRQKFDDEVRNMMPDLDLPNIPTSPSKAVTGYLNNLISSGNTTAGTEATGAAAASGAATTFSGGGVGAAFSGTDAPGETESIRPLLGRVEMTSPRRPPSVPLWTSATTMAAETRGADTVFVFDEPSMN